MDEGQGSCAIAVPSGPWYLSFALGLLENLVFLKEILVPLR